MRKCITCGRQYDDEHDGTYLHCVDCIEEEVRQDAQHRREYLIKIAAECPDLAEMYLSMLRDDT